MDEMFCEHGAPRGGHCGACEENAPPITPMTESERAMFDEDLELFFNTLSDKVKEGKISPEQAEKFFPKEVRNRNR